MDKIKKPGRRKRHYSKITQKHEDSAADNPQLINSIKEEDTDKFFEKENEINGLRTLSPTPCSSYTNEETKLLNQFESDKLFKNDPCILTENENTQSEVESANEDSIRGTSEEKNVTQIVPINIDEKLPLDNLKYMCSLCKADKTNCFVCGLVIDDSGQKIACKICKLKYQKLLLFI